VCSTADKYLTDIRILCLSAQALGLVPEAYKYLNLELEVYEKFGKTNAAGYFDCHKGLGEIYFKNLKVFESVSFF
jgi:hypothetical protein